MKSKILGLLAVGLLAGPMAANAGVVYTSPDFVTPGTVTGSWCSSCSGDYAMSDQFTLAAATTISGFDLAVQNNYGSNWNITVSIWDTTMATKLFETVVTSGSYTTAALPPREILISALIAGPTLAAGSYRMQWVDPIAMGIWSYGGNSTTSQQRRDGLIAGGGGGYGTRFQVYGDAATVPEPGTLALLGLGLAGLGLSRRRKAN